jgi:hypothetical protein
VITVGTTLGERSDAKRDAREICNTIQGADVADFTPGHKIVGQAGEVILTCST